MKIINLEINELPKRVLDDFLNKRNSFLNELRKDNKLKIFSTYAEDEKEVSRLYPAQTWASMNTGLKYSTHKCFFYSDKVPEEKLLWNELAIRGFSVGVLGSLHSSKTPETTNKSSTFSFYIPDCFAKEDFTIPSTYRNFQKFNTTLVGHSSRTTKLKSIIRLFRKYLWKILSHPKSFGISTYSIISLTKILLFSIKTRNKEILRNAQFPLLGSIFIDLYLKNKPNYSTIFSNHIAGNMHRYWYAEYNSDFSEQNLYPKEWVRLNSNNITFSVSLLDIFIQNLYKKIDPNKTFIIISSSMGQNHTPNFESKNLQNFDLKINNLTLLLNKFNIYSKKEFNINTKPIKEFSTSRNMAPHYALNIKGIKDEPERQKSKMALIQFFQSIHINASISDEHGYWILSISLSKEFLENHSLKSASEKFKGFGFKFFNIYDHLSGSHISEGVLMTIGAPKEFKDILNKNLNKNNVLPYLKFKPSIIEYLEQAKTTGSNNQKSSSLNC